jgi:Protein of unknown function (DUF3168)
MKEIDAALYTQLTTTATTLYGLAGARVYDTLAPQSLVLPAVVFNMQAGGDRNLAPTDVIELVYNVRGMAATQSAANNVTSAIRERLHNAALSVSGWNYISCMCDGEYAMEELVNGVPVFHRGYLVRIRVSK